jgi:hypothetical protein
MEIGGGRVQLRPSGGGNPIAHRWATESPATKPGEASSVLFRAMQKLDQLSRPETHSAAARLKMTVALQWPSSEGSWYETPSVK